MSKGRCLAAVAVMLMVAVAAACTRKPAIGPAEETRSAFRAAIVRPSTLDPAQARTPPELLVADQLYDALASYDTNTLDAVPAVAAGWTSSPDQQHWDFTLRPDARFADGSPLTSSDVKATFDRIARKGTGSSVADLLEPVAGYAAVAVDGTTSELAGVTTPAPDVVRIDLDQPWSVLPAVLAHPAFGILPREVAEEPRFPEDNMKGSGPFMAAAEETRLVLTPAPGVAARTPRLELLLFETQQQAYVAFQQGQADWTTVPPEKATEAAALYGRQLFKPHVAQLFYSFNLRSPKFADPRLREAITLSVNRETIIAGVYGGNLLPLDGLLLQGLPGHQERPCGDRCSFNRERAAALVADLAASGPLPEIQIDFEEDRTQSAVAASILADLAAVGIPAALRPKPLVDYQAFAVTGEQELFRLGWVAPYPSADAILTPLFRSGSPNNLTGLASPAVDEPLLLARAETDPVRRLEYLQQAERAVLAEFAVIPIAQFETQSVASPRVRGLEVGLTGTFDGRSVWIEPKR